MNFSEYIDAIRFRYIQPQKKTPPGYGEMRKWLGWAGIYIDTLNTQLPEDNLESREALRTLCKIPRMSTLAIAAILNKAVAQMPPQHAYLNIGVWNGFTFLSGLATHPEKTCLGVDNFVRFGGPREAFQKRFNQWKSPNHRFYDMDYLEYFAKVHRETLGVYLFDGPHSYEHQLKGLQVAEPFFSENCIILVDDTNNDDPRNGTLDFVRQSRNKYKILADLKTSRNGHPTFWNGLMVLQRVS